MIRRTALSALLVIMPQLAAAAPITEVHYVMGTYLRIMVEDADPSHARAAMRRCFAMTRHLDELFTRFDARSELSRLNAGTEDTPTVSIEMAALLGRALTLQTATDGAFDISVGALTRLWRDTSKWPDRAAIHAARRSDGPDALQLIGTTLVRRPGVQIDLDGIAKGWAVDRCVSQLREDGIEHAFLNFGESSLYALGAPNGARGWHVEVRGLDSDRALGTLTLRDQALSASGVFGHARRIGRRRIGHIVDPRTGQPLSAPAMAVVVAASATDAEAFSKAILVETGFVQEGRAEGSITGALRITPFGVERIGGISFTPFSAARRITAAAEPLR